MMAKHPGLTVVGGVGMAVAIAICAASFGIISTAVDAAVPLPGGDRIVAIRNVDTRTSSKASGTHLHDLATWRASHTAVEDLGAFRTIERNLITPGGRPESVRIAEMSASGFRLTRVPPLTGRYFNEADERTGAPPVVVIGYTIWQHRFAGRPDVVGQRLQLGDTRYTIVGVMPEGYAFPVNNRIWTPLRLDPTDFAPGQAPPIDVFGRLAPSATLSDAQAQLNAIGQRLAVTSPDSHEHVRPRVIPYARSFLNPGAAWQLHLAGILVSLLLVVIGTNAAILVYARTATRTGEIAVRSALGASRARIVAQLFAEALVLSGVSAAVGMVGTRVIFHEINAFLARLNGWRFPFWYHFDISAAMLLYIAGLAVLATVIVGVVPALEATRSRVHANLQLFGVGGSGMRLGRTWTMLIIAQVAVAVAVLPVAFAGSARWMRLQFAQPAFASRQVLMAMLVLDEQDARGQRPETRQPVTRPLITPDVTNANPDAVHDRALSAHFAQLRAQLIGRLDAEPGVADVAVASEPPGDEPTVRIELDSAAATPIDHPPATPMRASVAAHVNRVSPGFFRTFGVPMLAGRRFQSGDFSPSATAVIVNRSFVRNVLGGGNPLGRRVRSTAAATGSATPRSAPSAPWAEIVGVVPDFPNPIGGDSSSIAPTMYRPLLPTDARPVWLAIRVRGGGSVSPLSVASRVREITVTVNPLLRLGNIATLDQIQRRITWADRLFLLLVTLIALSTLLLSAAGIYALMSLTVTRRRREIGVRLALGGQPRRLLASVLGRAMGQVAVGIVAGACIFALIDFGLNGRLIDGSDVVRLVATAAIMAAVGLFAAIGPARRALRIQPTEALKAE
jgi:hypothetical protein